ncbi:phage portal protein [Nocardioides alcanivorans]|uniref:phage portal protein n=1 Tax=Nocardioides alcanivorans TaxID=2897352 RepID=UPI001F17EBF8|nr:phage portal protein [Nocardioides alcanivorans]
MGFLQSLVRREPLTPATSPAASRALARTERSLSFALDIDPGTLYGVQSADQANIFPNHPRISRREALSVPSVKRGRDLIAVLGSLPLRLLDADNQVTPCTLLCQPEDGIPSVITWTRVVEDLIFGEAAGLAVTAFGWDGRPATVVHLDQDSISVPTHTQSYRTVTGSGTATRYAPDPLLIRIDSPTPPLLVHGARAIRALGRLEAAALNAADGVPPQDFFTPADEGVDPFPNDGDLDEDGEEINEVGEFLADWMRMRQIRATGYVPHNLKYNVNGFNPKDLQLVEAREMAITEIARLMGIDGDELGVSTTSRTYANMQDRRRQFLDFTLGPYMRAIEGRLSMDDVTPPGYTVRFDTSQFAAADDKTAAETDEILIRAKVQTVEEVRARRGLATSAAQPSKEIDA